MRPEKRVENPDVVIAGGGPVGSVLAHALAPLAGPGFSVLQIRGAAPTGDRPIALSHGSRLILDRLGLWQGLPATPIHRIHVSQRGGFGRTLISAADHGIDALGHVTSYQDLARSTRLATAATGAMTGLAVREDRVNTWTAGPDGIEVQLGSEPLGTKTIRTRLLIVADGGQPDADPRAARFKDYRQSAVVCEIDTEHRHGNLAWERFTPDGPLALLPFRDRYALVWTSPSAQAEHLCALGEEAFLAELQRAFGNRAGPFRAAGPRTAFQLSLRVRKNRAQAGVIAIGNAAQTLHPVAGQGLNLGLRDAWELAAACTRCVDGTPDDLGSETFARSFAAQRKPDRDIMVRLTDGMLGAFSVRLPCSSAIRGAALAFLDTVPPARRFLSRRMMFGARALP